MFVSVFSNSPADYIWWKAARHSGGSKPGPGHAGRSHGASAARARLGLLRLELPRLNRDTDPGPPGRAAAASGPSRVPPVGSSVMAAPAPASVVPSAWARRRSESAWATPPDGSYSGPGTEVAGWAAARDSGGRNFNSESALAWGCQWAAAFRRP